METISENLTFLVVDDEEAILLGLKTIIAKNFPKSTVRTSKDGLEAWNSIKQFHPLIVISDLSMPQMNGLQLCSKVREYEEFDDIYFIIVTATTDKEQRMKALELGTDDFISKPFATEELIARLRSAARFSELRRKQTEENQLLIELAEQLELNIKDLTQLAVKFLQARIPTSTDMLKRVANASVWIAKQLGELDEEQIGRAHV